LLGSCKKGIIFPRFLIPRFLKGRRNVGSTFIKFSTLALALLLSCLLAGASQATPAHTGSFTFTTTAQGSIAPCRIVGSPCCCGIVGVAWGWKKS